MPFIQIAKCSAFCTVHCLGSRLFLVLNGIHPRDGPAKYPSIHPSTHSHSMTSFFVKQWIRHVYVTDCITCHFKKVDRMDQQKLVTPTFQGWIFFHFDSWLLDSYRMRYLFPHGTRDARHNKNEKYRLFNASAMDNHNEIKNKTFFMQAWSKHNVKAC